MRSGLRRACEHVLFYGLLTAFGLICLAWSLPAVLLDRLLPRRTGAPLGQFMIMACFRAFLALAEAAGVMRCELGGLDALRDAGPIVICPNHPSLLDVVLVVSRLPKVVCITKAQIWDNLFLGGGARLAGYIRNDRPGKLVRMAAAEVRAGRQLLIFPEGTRTEKPPVGPFKGGFALIAKTAGVPVQSVFIRANSNFLGKGWPLFKKPDFPLIYRIELGRRLDTVGEVRSFVSDLERYFHAELQGDES